MKKWAALTALAVAMPMASAKVLISIDGGLGYSGNSLADDSNIGGDDGVELASDNNTNGLNMSADGGLYAWAKISLPVLPDLKLKYEDLKMAGENTLNRTFTYGNQTYDVTGQVSTELDLSYIDFAFTYGVPLPMIDIDFGINARTMIGGFTIEGNLDNQPSQKEEVDFSDSDLPAVIPMAYVSLAATIPTTDLTLSTELSTLPLGDTNITDWNLKGTWFAPLPTNALLKVGLEAGYRYYNVKIGESTLGADTKDLESDIGISSFFIGGTVHF